jgi:hypothetical protein
MLGNRRITLQGPAPEHKHLLLRLLVPKVSDALVGKVYSFAELILPLWQMAYHIYYAYN